MPHPENPWFPVEDMPPRYKKYVPNTQTQVVTGLLR